METLLLNGQDAIEQIANFWPELHARTEPRPPMLELSWVRQWWRLHREEGELAIVLARNKDRRPIGIAPLYCRSFALSSRQFLRTVHFIGTGEREGDEVVGEYNSWLAGPEAMPEVTRAVAETLAQNPGFWDRLRLERLRREARIHEELPPLLNALASSCSVAEAPTYRSPVMDVESYVSALPSGNFRHRCRRALKAARELGLEFVRARTPNEKHAMFTALRKLHQRRWSARGEPGAFASPVFTAFHQAMLAGGSDDRAWLVGLRHGRDFLAVRYYLRGGDTLYDYVSGVDTDVPTALAPGLVLHLKTLEACQDAGLRFYDFMGGDYEYKRQLALVRDANVTVDLFSRTAAARLWLVARDLHRRINQVRGRVRPVDEAALAN